LTTAKPDTPVQQLMMHEMADPTPMLDVVAQRVIRPRLEYLFAVVGEILKLPPADGRVQAAAFSVHAQCMMTKSLVMIPRLKLGIALTPNDAPKLAEHIADFSLRALTGR
jgi:hypothetical protein